MKGNPVSLSGTAARREAARGVVLRVLSLQLVVTVAAAVAWGTLQNRQAALAALVGGAIAIVGGWIYARKMLVMDTINPAVMMGAQYRAEAYKLVITIALFTATFVLYREISPLPFFSTYVLALLVYWVALLFKS